MCICLNVVPTKAPRRFTVNATTSTSVVASWELPPVGSRNGIIKGFHLDFKRKDSDSSSIVLIESPSILNMTLSSLDKFTEYEFQVSAFTSAGAGMKSSVKEVRTKEDGKGSVLRGFKKL